MLATQYEHTFSLKCYIKCPTTIGSGVILLSLVYYYTFMHLADAFIQSDLQYIQAIHVLSVCVFPGN